MGHDDRPPRGGCADSARKSPSLISDTVGVDRAIGAPGPPAKSLVTDESLPAWRREPTPSANTVRVARERKLQLMKRIRDRRLLATLKRLHIKVPGPVPPHKRGVKGPRRNQLNRSLQTALSALIVARGYSIPELVELARGQTPSDYRPNKALCPDDIVCLVAARGITPRWATPVAHGRLHVNNHQSANRHLNAVVVSIRRGQDAVQYLVLSDDVLQHLEGVHISPLGTVEVRLIHDLSFPRGHSVNEASVKDHFPAVVYRHVPPLPSASSSSHESTPTEGPFFAYEWVDDHGMVAVDTPIVWPQQTKRYA
ncbi:Hypothetical protein PHPALM_347 [Phytophthora palmivora]|uniref:Uncharacterized protein n=1 Tax=Phytophthora palmivora TaxID=4796 RepID=A0A2P4YV30_9STRA|nr:Hypothetical protein PHPALM_347 [Phytophthora palmivora]